MWLNNFDPVVRIDWDGATEELRRLSHLIETVSLVFQTIFAPNDARISKFNLMSAMLGTFETMHSCSVRSGTHKLLSIEFFAP